MDARDTTVVVLDLASVRLHRTGRRVDVLTSAGELLATVHAAADEPVRLTCYRAFEAAVGARVTRAVDDGTGRYALAALPVALYNPSTAQVATADMGRARVHGDGRPVPLDEAGQVARVGADGALHVAGRALPCLELASRSMSRELAAHRMPVAA